MMTRRATCASLKPAGIPRARADTARAYPVGAVLGSYRLLQQIGAGGMGASSSPST